MNFRWDDNLFKNYIREFLKLKIESSGWDPDLCHPDFPPEELPNPDDPNLTEQQRIEIEKIVKKRQAFIDETLEIYGIIIDPGNMKKNLGLRYIAKVSNILNLLY